MIRDHINGQGASADPNINAARSENALKMSSTDREIENLQRQIQGSCII
jgi:hypothetical protein